jgi:hypothetical protein
MIRNDTITAVVGFLLLLATGASLAPEAEERFWTAVQTASAILTERPADQPG